MHEESKGRRLCIDYGTKRLGVAISDPTGIIAQPLAVIERTSDEHDLGEIGGLIEKYEVRKIVIGIPFELSGRAGKSATEVFRFIDKLQDSLKGIEVDTWDERLTTAFAERELIRDKVTRKRRKKVIDKLAATIILQSYLDAESRDG